MLRLENVGYRYAGTDKPALTGINLELRDAEVLGVAGAGDAGKSTLCYVASGLAPRTIRGTLTGRLLVDREDVADQPIHALVAKVGIAFQNPATQLSGVCVTVYEEVAFGPMNLGLPRTEVLSRTEEALRSVGITELAERDPARLSGGQMQLVGLAGLLALRPGHLVLDEPTAQLDPYGTRLVADALARLTAAGVSVLVVEQKTDLLAAICSRVVILSGGRIVREGPTPEVLAAPDLASLGVAPPSAERLRRAVVDAGIDPERIAA
jgi:energy-coupling factor transport system ATP-binding protein